MHPFAAPTPIRRTSLAAAVYEYLLEAILSGRFTAGRELSEVELAAELGVSRTPVHEAVRRLTADGLVQTGAAGQASIVQFSPAEISEIYELRLCLEPAAAERAASRIEPNVLVELRRTADDLLHAVDARNWPARALAFDIRFHDALADACGNRRLAAEIAKYRRLVRAFCRRSGSRANLLAALNEHRVILESLERGDGEAARRATAEHIRARSAAVLDDVAASAKPTSPGRRRKNPVRNGR